VRKMGQGRLVRPGGVRTALETEGWQMKQIHKAVMLAFVLMLVGTLGAQGKRVVSFWVELPNGAKPQFKAIEGQAVSAELKDAKYGFVPAIDSGNEAVVHMGVYDLSVTPHKQLGTVDVTVGGNSVQSDTAPAFIFRVLGVSTQPQ
jgi:hypothetical protein